MSRTWEYDLIHWAEDATWSGGIGDDGIKAMLTDKGADGWELVSVISYPSDDGASHRLFFKRLSDAADDR
jgi:Domain of unknown function (DUF4177)